MNGKHRLWAWPVLAAALLAALCHGQAVAGERMHGKTFLPQDIDSDTRIDANSIDMWVTNQGSFGHDPVTGNPGFIYPRGTTKSVIFASGLWIGAKVDGETRVSLAEYSFDYAPGPIISPTEYADPGDPRYRVYKIARGDTRESNPDFAEWPVGDGAPVDSAGNPLIIGDMTLWCVYNDLNPRFRENVASTQRGMGLEVQQTTFAFDRNDPLGNVVFLKFRIINKGANTLEDTYVSTWSDPDVGGPFDDLVGCDTELSLGYSYNATNTDSQYGSEPPAVGIDFFQGPIVPAPGDTAYVSGVAVPDYRNLPMTSFNKYINGTDPESPVETYNYMQGLTRYGAPLTNPDGSVTTFFASGDPVANTGWIDSDPSDRRMFLTSGPFTMQPGDVQEVVVGIIVGAGRDRLTSVTALKFNDRFAQFAFDKNFDLPGPPPRPEVRWGQLDDQIVLYWDDRSELEYNEEGYAFQGYNVYQGESVSGPWRRIHTFDVIDNVAVIFDDQFDMETGVVINKPVQFGSDSGLSRRVIIRDDVIRGGSLVNGRPYYFAVTAYALGADQEPGLKTLENRPEGITLIPQKPQAGVRHEDGAPGDTLAVVHSGNSDGRVIPLVINPEAIVPETYTVGFAEDDRGVYWDLTASGGRELLSGQRNQSGDDDYLVADGILWKVEGAEPGFKRNLRPLPMVDEIIGPGGDPVTADEFGGPGNDVFLSLNSTGEWYLSAGGGDGANEEAGFTRSEGNLSSRDILMKWDDDPHNLGWWWFDSEEVGRLPFGLYLRDPATGEEDRLIPILYSGCGEDCTPGVFDFSDPDVVIDGAYGYPVTDWIYAYTILDGESYEGFVEDAADGVIDNDIAEYELFARLVVGGFTYDPDAAPPVPPTMPAPGTVIQFSTTKPNTPEDVFKIDTRGASFSGGHARQDLKLIRAVPNPYYAHSAYEFNRYRHVLKFTRLPEACTVRIFNIAGDLVRTLVKEPGPGSFLEWNLLTDRALPVGSGVYIYHVEAPGIGSTYGRVAVFIEKEQLRVF